MKFTVPSKELLSPSQINERRQQLREMMQRTLVSLLRCYQPQKDAKFYGVRRDTLAKEATFRDTATVLTAIETSARRRLMDHGSGDKERTDTPFEFISGLSSDGAIPYVGYRDHVFNPAAGKIAAIGTPAGEPLLASQQESLLRSSTSDQASPDPFTASVILRFLTHYQKDVSYDKVYATTGESVIEALSRLHPPQRQFGGASLTGIEPNAFVSYSCLIALRSIVESLKQRARDHETLDNIFEQVSEWQESKSSNIRLEYLNEADFFGQINKRLKGLESAVGIGGLAAKVRKTLDSSGTSAGTLRVSCVVDTKWIDRYLRLVVRELNEIVRKLKQQGRDLSALAKYSDARGPREAWAETAKEQMHGAERAWRAIFLQGMYELTTELKAAYDKLATSPGKPGHTIRTVRARLKAVIRIWKSASDRTEKYLEQFADWGTAEMQRQLAFHAGKQHTNFDPIQLLFAVRIHHEFSATRHDGLVIRALDVLLSTQQPDGSWAGDAPFANISDSSAGIYVSALEAMHGLLPLIRHHEWFQKSHGNIQRTFQWLQTNERKLPVSRDTLGWPKSDGNKHAEPFVTISGWSTEKPNDPRRIDVWMSALALQFMAQYDDFLHDLLKKQAAKLYNVKDARNIELPIEKMVDSELGVVLPMRVREQIIDQYVEPFRARGQNKSSSLLLYGPPGTAKTTVAEGIAKSLGWSLLTITPSDFVKRGLERSEYWARRIFDDLLRLRNTVVFFDEIDEMLRSRASSNRQGTTGMLQFIVPGMLPKLQALKQYGESAPLIIVIATNYQDRLDAAITRAGRIDHKFQVMPPDFVSRQRLLRLFFNKDLAGPQTKPATTKALDQIEMLREAINRLSNITGGWTFKELQGLANAIKRESQQPDRSTGSLGKWVNQLCAAIEPKQALRQRAYTTAAEIEIDLVMDGLTILKETRALKLRDWYENRENGAEEEATRVLEICMVRDGIPQPQTRDQAIRAKEAEAITAVAKKLCLKRSLVTGGADPSSH